MNQKICCELFSVSRVYAVNLCCQTIQSQTTVTNCLISFQESLPMDHPLRQNTHVCLVSGCDSEHCVKSRCCTEHEEDGYTNRLLQRSKSAPATSGQEEERLIGSAHVFNKSANCHCLCKSPVFCLKCQMCGGAVHIEGANNCNVPVPPYYANVKDQSTCTISFEGEPSFSSATDDRLFESVT